jgi:hypothetical protein
VRWARPSACSGTSRTPSSTPSRTGWPTSGSWPVGGGRRTRRKTYSLTGPGLDALREWLAAPTAEHFQLRDVAELKLFFHEVGEPEHVAALAAEQIVQHRRRIALYDDLLANDGSPSLELGLELEHAAAAILDGARPRTTSPAAQAARSGMNRPGRRLVSTWLR